MKLTAEQIADMCLLAMDAMDYHSFEDHELENIGASGEVAKSCLETAGQSDAYARWTKEYWLEQINNLSN